METSLDIVERLRSDAPEPWELEWALRCEAADEIEQLRDHVNALLLVATSHEPEALRLQAEIERLRALLREAVLYDNQIIHMESWWRKVRRALENKP